MPLTPGTRIGPYEIVGAIGAGGMGEVYRARDSRLARDVAVKVLPPSLENDPERLARFDREAKTLAALNHPHIAQIYGLEEGGSTRALVLELVDGDTLADRLVDGPIPFDEALTMAVQIADALEAAHEHGIVHRDLKPANIKITPAGTIKVLDFGLAKLSGADGPPNRLRQGYGGQEGDEHDDDVAPTMTSPALMTGIGVILGTAAYMSPEQARGKTVDKRADIWAFGAVLFEMLTGRRAFAGDSVTEVAAAVIHVDPDWSALPTNTSAATRLVLQRCLQKDPKQRLHDMGDVRLVLAGGFDTGTSIAPASSSATRPMWKRALLWAAVAIVAIGWATTAFRTPSPSSAPLIRFPVSLGPRGVFTGQVPFTISPDGMLFAYYALGDDKLARLSVRQLDQRDGRALPGTENSQSPFFSPDGRWLGFFKMGKLWKVSVDGGSPSPLCDAIEPRGASWGADGFIILEPDRLGGLSRCPSAGGGTAETVTKLDSSTGEISHRWPQALDGVALFTSTKTATTPDDNSIVAQSLKTGERKVLWKGGTYGRYVPSGHLLFVARNTLFAAPMNLSRLELTGAPTPMMEDVVTNIGSDWAAYDVSTSGTLVFAHQDPFARLSVQQLQAGTRDVRPLVPGAGRFSAFTYSPDGSRGAYQLGQGGGNDVWVYDIARDRRTRVTFSPFVQSSRVEWSPSGQYVVFADRTARRDGIETIRADGSGDTVRLLEGRGSLISMTISPDGTRLVFSEVDPGGGVANGDLWVLPVDFNAATPRATGAPEAILKTRFDERAAKFSRDGRWLAYESNESGSVEVYVRAFPALGSKTQISSGGGSTPVWSADGKEIFYVASSGLIMRVPFTVSGSTFAPDRPRPVSELAVPGDLMDVSRDGKAFVFIGTAGGENAAPIEVTFALNFLDEIRRRVGVAK